MSTIEELQKLSEREDTSCQTKAVKTESTKVQLISFITAGL